MLILATLVSQFLTQASNNIHTAKGLTSENKILRMGSCS